MNQSWQRIFGCAVVLAGVGCGTEQSDEGDTTSIVLGAVVDQSGAAGPGTWADAARLAASQMNDALAQAGSQIRFRMVVSDSTNVPSVAAERAENLVRSEGAVGLVLDTSQDALAVVQLQYDDDAANHLNVPMASLVATSPSFGSPDAEHPDPVAQAAFRDADGWHFRTSMSSAPQGIVLTRILQDLGGTSTKTAR